MQPQKEKQVQASSNVDSRASAPAGNRASQIVLVLGLVALVSTIGAMWAASHVLPVVTFSVARSADPGGWNSGDEEGRLANQVVRRGNMPEVAGLPLRYIVVLAHFEGDPNHQVESQVRQELERLDPAFGVKIVSYESSLSSQPTREDVQAARAYMARAQAKALIGGSIRGDGGKPVVEMTIVNEAREPFDRVYSPPDFKLPQIPLDQQLQVLRLAIAVGSSGFFAKYGYFNRGSIPPLTAGVERIADSSVAHTWSPDARARVNFVAARGFETSNHWGDYRRAIVDYLWSLNEWRRDRLGSAMVLVNLGEVLSGLKEDDTALAMFADASKNFESAGAREDLGETHNRIGRTLNDIGNRESGQVRLRQAVAEYNLALAIFVRANFPYHWAETKGYLARTLQSIGEREVGIESFTAAAKAYRESLEVFTRADTPYEWSANQSALGMDLTRIGSREDATTPLEEAEAAERLALQVITPSYNFFAWVRAEMGLADVLQTEGQRTYDQVRLDEAVRIYRDVIAMCAHSSMVDEWSEAQRALANTLFTIGEHEPGSAQLEESIAACRAYLRVNPRERAPLLWALGQEDLGQSLSKLGERTRNLHYLEQSIAASRRALEVLREDREPLDWSTTHANLGLALMALSDNESDRAASEDAAAALDSLQQAAKAVSRENNTRAWAAAQTNIASALTSIGEHESGTAHLEQAVKVYSDLFTIVTPEKDPEAWAWLEYNLAGALFDIGERESGTSHLEQAAEAYKKALRVLSPSKTPEQWQETQDNLKTAVDALHDRGWKG
jgi:tetratricopeptide (TPR) repeat protein